MPDPYWVSSHWLSDNDYGPGQPKFSSNLVVYENYPDVLALHRSHFGVGR